MTHVSEQGRKALIEVAEWLERGAPHVRISGTFDIHHFDMEYSVEPDHYSEELNTCGTACCIAGAVCQFNMLGGEKERTENGALPFFGNYTWDEMKGEVVPTTKGALDLATEHLGLSDQAAQELFVPWEHFDLHYDAFEDLGVYSDTKLAAKVVRNFLATGVVDWNIDREQEDTNA